MHFKPVLIFCMLLSVACNNTATSYNNKLNSNQTTVKSSTDKNPYHSICAIPLPDSFVRIKADSNSFASWLRNITLKENKTVYLFNGHAQKQTSWHNLLCWIFL